MPVLADRRALSLIVVRAIGGGWRSIEQVLATWAHFLRPIAENP